MKSSKRGISLIVLIITILVMIIIAAAVILYLDDSKVIRNAKKAVTANDVSAAKEVVAVARAAWRTNKEKIQEDGYATFKSYAESKLEENGYEIGKNGGQVKVDESGLLYAYVEPVIPEGFVASQASGEDEVIEGLVIYEGYEDVTDENVEEAQETRNQYVWVPVPNIGEFTRTEGYYSGVLQTYLSSGQATEPYSYDSSITELNDKTKTGEYAEYAKMKESVAKYGGFFIARYEAGTSIKREDAFNGTSTANSTAQDIYSQKDKYVYNFVGWGPSMISATGNVIEHQREYGKGAVELSRSIYPESANKGVVSTLCYGVQWDAAMDFMSDVANPNASGKSFLEDTSLIGWYRNNKADNPDYKTGIDVDTNKSNMIKNIYDMAGNVGEWTMEASKDSARIYRRRRYYCYW